MDGYEECDPTDGLYSPTHSECEKCYGPAKRVCQVFAVYRGLKTPADLIKIEEIRLEKEPGIPISKLIKAKGGW